MRSGGPFWSHQLTPKDALELSATYSRFDRRSGPDLKTDTAGGGAKLSHKFTPRLDGFVNAGGRYTRTTEDVFNGVTFVSRTDESAGVSAGGILVAGFERDMTMYLYKAEAGADGRQGVGPRRGEPPLRKGGSVAACEVWRRPVASRQGLSMPRRDAAKRLEWVARVSVGVDKCGVV